MAVARRPQDRAVVGRASLLLRLIGLYGDTHTNTHTQACTCARRVMLGSRDDSKHQVSRFTEAKRRH